MQENHARKLLLKAAQENRGRKTLTAREAASALGCPSTEESVERVSEVVGLGLLAPVKSAGSIVLAGKPSPAAYRITERCYSLPDDVASLLDSLHHSLSPARRWVSANPGRLDPHARFMLEKLNDYMWENAAMQGATLRERAFEIWGNEKELETKRSMDLVCRFLGTTREGAVAALGCHEPQDCYFPTSAIELHTHMRILVAENKDTFDSAQRALRESRGHMLFGERFDAAVCGWGNKVTAPGRLETHLEMIFGSERTFEVAYWGDIDAEGLRIAERLGELCAQSSSITGFELLAAAYEATARRSMESELEPPRGAEKPCPHTPLSVQLGAGGEAWAAYADEVAARGDRIPQEACSLAFLKTTASGMEPR